MGTEGQEGGGGWVVLDGQTFDVKGRWEKGVGDLPLGYDYWYQPYHNVMVSSEFGTPKAFMAGFNPEHVEKYRNLWNFSNFANILYFFKIL